MFRFQSMSFMLCVAAIAFSLPAGAQHSVEPYPYLNRGQLMNISRASQEMGRGPIWEGGRRNYGMQFGPELISWIVVVAPTAYNRRGRVSCAISTVTAVSEGRTIYPTYVGQLPASGGIQAYYRINQGMGRPLDYITVGMQGNTLIQSECGVNVHVVRGAFDPSFEGPIE